MTTPFIELIELKQQEKKIADAIIAKREEALEWHFTLEDSIKPTSKRN